MGKASSNKKIARAQRAGAKSTAGKPRGWLYPASIIMVFALGTLLVLVAHSSRDAEATGPPRLTDHWHAAYSVVICDEFQAPILDETDPSGIHTHGDGVIHIHPFSESVAGDNAQLGAFLEASGLEVTDDRISVPGGPEVVEGVDTCNDADAQVRVARWANADAVDTTEPQIFTESFDKIRFLGDREAVTIFFGASDAEIPPPDTIPALDNLTDIGETDPTGAPISEPGATVSDAPADPAVTVGTDPATETTPTTGE